MLTVGDPFSVWVRRCQACGDEDFGSAFGHPSIIDDRPWACPWCETTRWSPVRVELPA